MNRKILIIVIIIVSIIGILMINKFWSKNVSTDKNNNTSNIIQNEDSNMYYILDENGEVIHEAESEDSLYIYTIDPEYDPQMPE